MSGDRIVLGEQAPATSPAVDRPNRLAALLIVTAFAVAVVAFRPPAPVVPTPTALDAPVEPPSGGGHARNWQVVDLDGSGSRVSAVEGGPAGWLAVAVEGGVSLHVSGDGLRWETSDLPELDGTDPVVSVGVLSMGAAFVPDDRSGIAAVVSTDGGARWAVDTLTRAEAWLGGLEEIDLRLHAFGSVGTESGFQWRDEGEAAAWVYDGFWRSVEVEGGQGSVITTSLAVDDELVLFGHTRLGPTAWRLIDDTFRAFELDVPVGGEDRSIIEVVFDGDRHVALVGDKGLSNGGRTLWQSTDLTTWTLLGDKVFKLVTLESDGAGTLLGRLGESGGLWVSTRSAESQTYGFGIANGTVISPYLSALAVHDGTVVAGAGSVEGASLLVRPG